MKRRQFLSTGVAAASLPLLPVSAAPFSGASYAQLSAAAGSWAYASVGAVKRFLGVDEAAARAMMARLQSDGVIGAVGPTGLAQAPAMRVAQVAGVSRSVSAVEIDVSKICDVVLGAEEGSSEAPEDDESVALD